MKIVEGSLKRGTSPKGMLISFLTRDVHEADKLFEKLGEKPLEASIRPIRKARSLDANSYMWVLCDKIAKAIHNTKMKVYQEAVEQAGIWTDVAVETRALPTFLDKWNSKGDGWFADVAASKLKGCTKVRCYYGSSVYDTKQMARLIDYLVIQAKDLDIETMTPDELARMKMEWK